MQIKQFKNDKLFIETTKSSNAELIRGQNDFNQV
jgi:hypothetical protein